MMQRALDVEAILRARAHKLAISAQDESALQTEELATFSVGGHHLGVPTACVTHAATLRHLTEIPGGPAWIVGITTVEGQLVSLLDLSALLGLSHRGVGDVTSSLVVGWGGREIGLGAEQLFGIEDVPRTAIALLPSADGPVTRIARLADRQLLLLDVPTLLSDPRLGVRR
jgi:purine-binding chemotaxis protein CheW